MKLRNYVRGAWTESASTLWHDVYNPSSEQVVAQVPESTEAEIDDAVAAARDAAEGWAAVTFEERQESLAKIKAALDSRRADLVQAVMDDVGTPRRIADAVQVGVPGRIIDALLDLKAEDCEPVVKLGNSTVIHEPVGVVAAITPWNYPLYMVISKVMPALLAGNTVVLKPSEITPIAVDLLVQCIDAAGLPAGVFNLIHGTGPSVGEALVAHRGVDMVSFTGSTAAGKRVSKVASETLKRVHTELGGKGPHILLPDADLESSVKAAVGNCYLNSGQTCLALTRLLVHEAQYEQAVELAAAAAERFTVGAPDDPATKLGPMVSAEHKARVQRMIRDGITEGARVAAGGPEDADVEVGYFVRPTVLADVTSGMSVAQEEIFGPVLVVLSYRDEDDAVRIANDTIYGLSAGVRSADPDKALSVARRIKAGQVEVNGGAYNPAAPFGGYKQSGNGRELGRFGVREFYEIKSIQA